MRGMKRPCDEDGDDADGAMRGMKRPCQDPMNKQGDEDGDDADGDDAPLSRDELLQLCDEIRKETDNSSGGIWRKLYWQKRAEIEARVGHIKAAEEQAAKAEQQLIVAIKNASNAHKLLNEKDNVETGSLQVQLKTAKHTIQRLQDELQGLQDELQDLQKQLQKHGDDGCLWALNSAHRDYPERTRLVCIEIPRSDTDGGCEQPTSLSLSQ